MKHIEYFEANDGTRFEHELDCMEYELSNDFQALDTLIIKTFDGCTLTELTERAINDTEIVVINDEKASAMARQINLYYGFEIPTEIGGYWWDSDEQEWLSYDEIENYYYYFKNIKKELASLL